MIGDECKCGQSNKRARSLSVMLNEIFSPIPSRSRRLARNQKSNNKRNIFEDDKKALNMKSGAYERESKLKRIR